VIHGSPRKKANTATWLRKAIEGAESAGAKTELIHLYDLQYTGCVSCVLSASGTTESTTADA